MEDKISASIVAEKIFDLYKNHGDGDYLGESVSITAHSIQAAMLAEREDHSIETVLAAFLHDVGHLVGADSDLEPMVTDGVTLGARDHDKVGAVYLHGLGIPDAICALVRRHVDAKRYLVFKDRAYCLSEASRLTLAHQGGPMTAEEAAKFERAPEFSAALAIRRYDELAKDEHVAVDPLDKYKTLLVDYLSTVTRPHCAEAQ